MEKKYLRKKFCQIELKIKITIFFSKREEEVERKIENKFENFEWMVVGGYGCNSWFSVVIIFEKIFFKKTVKTRFFSIQTFKNSTIGATIPMKTWWYGGYFFLKGSWCLKSEYTMILLTTLESQGLFNNYFCHLQKFC